MPVIGIKSKLIRQYKVVGDLVHDSQILDGLIISKDEIVILDSAHTTESHYELIESKSNQ